MILLLLHFFSLTSFHTFQTLEFLVSAVASDDLPCDLRRCNPFLEAQDCHGIHCCLILLMMVFCRVSQCNAAIIQCSSVIKVLETLQKTTTQTERYFKELAALSEMLGNTITMKRTYVINSKPGLFEVDPRFLLFEFCHGIILRPSQVVLVRKLVADMSQNKPACTQMIMGAGKTTVVGPLLAVLLSSHKSLVMEVVPPALLEFSAGVLRERFGLFIPKTIFTFSFDRYQTVTNLMVSKLEIARLMRSVIVAHPSSVKSFMLKFLELSHNLERQKNLVLEKREKKTYSFLQSLSKMRNLLGLGLGRTASSGEMTKDEIVASRNQLQYCERIFSILRDSVEIMDEVDIILHPLKSELNWPLGAKDPLDFTQSRIGNGLRWALPSHLLDAIFGVCKVPILADIADSKTAGNYIFSFVSETSLISLSLSSRNFEGIGFRCGRRVS
jgi:hypothetical protein